MRRNDERHARRPRPPASLRPRSGSALVAARAAVVRGRSRRRASSPRLDRMVGRLEAQHQQHRRRRSAPALRNASAGSSSRQFAGYSPDCAIARVAATACGVGRRTRTDAAALPPRPVLQPHPRLGDHAERALGAEEQPVGRRARARSGQPARLADPDRGDHAHRLDQVVDVGVERWRSGRRRGWRASRRAWRTRTTAGSAAASARAAAAGPRARARGRRPGSARPG